VPIPGNCTWPEVEDTLNPGQCVTYADCPAGQNPDPDNEFQCIPSQCQQGNLQRVNYGSYTAFKASDISLNVPSPVCIQTCQYDVATVNLELAIKGQDCGTINGELACGSPSEFVLAINAYGTGQTCQTNTEPPQCTTCTTFNSSGTETPAPTQLPGDTQTSANQPVSTSTDTQTNPDGTQTKTDTKNYIDGSQHITITQYDSNGNITGQSSSIEGGGQAAEDAAGCDPEIEFCGSAPTSGSGLDTETDKTFAGSLADFSTRIQNAQAFTAITGFFTINIPAGSCPSWTLDTWEFSFDFNFFCSQIMLDLWPLIAAILLATAGVLAFRIGVLEK
jgi:hypothetical protein